MRINAPIVGTGDRLLTDVLEELGIRVKASALEVRRAIGHEQ